jgi:hypothetical protein
MKTADELRAELAALESQQSAAPATPAAGEPSEEQVIRGIFDDLLDLDGSKARERQEIEDQTMQVCASCFFLQRKANANCELCGDAAGWLVPSQARKNSEHDMFISMAADCTIEQLRVSLHSGWSHTPSRERVARLLLALREAKLHSQLEANIQTECTAPEDSPRSVLDGIDLGRVATGYDRQLAQIDQKLEQLKAGQQASTTEASAS